MSALPPATAGSSPLTRGKRTWGRAARLPSGLIPAHAGKTARRPASRLRSGAHPRSRGENGPRLAAPWTFSGSSPLTRGKLGGHRTPGEQTKAHPRSRGENHSQTPALSQQRGSSPLTRGKRPEQGTELLVFGLIPAHAGKTLHLVTVDEAWAAHPRSRGENAPGIASANWFQGSSPLTRGKRPRRAGRLRGRGLIPAHAGKTDSPLRWPN